MDDEEPSRSYKRPRSEGASSSSPSAASAAAAALASSFTFGFFDDGKSRTNGASSVATADESNGGRLHAAEVNKEGGSHHLPPPRGRFAILRMMEDGAGIGQAEPLANGDHVRILWEESSHFRIRVRRLSDGLMGRVKPSQLTALPSVDDGNAAQQQIIDSSLMLHLDPVFSSSGGHHVIAAPIFESSLQSLIWPLSVEAFIKTIYQQRRPFCVQGVGTRASQVLKDLGGVEVGKLLETASKIVIWMKALDGEGEVQYIEAHSPDIARACYRASHSLYFNPAEGLQKLYIQSVLRDLGMNLGAGVEVGLGGDMEVFAVKGKHSTPWHFDGQDNFTIQLRGMKRWTLAPSGVIDPMTNCHPFSSNVASRIDDRAVHAACGKPILSPPPPSLNSTDSTAATATGQTSVLLRPGSILFVPAGWWHKVESLGDHEDGSLSINLSLDSCRWSDVVSRSLGPLLWGEKEAWRARARVGPSGDMTEAKKVLGEILQGLKERLAKLEPDDFLPPSVWLAGGRSRRSRLIVDEIMDGEEDSSEEEEEEEGGGWEADEKRARSAAVKQAREALDLIGGKGGWGANFVENMVIIRSPLATLTIDQRIGSEEEGTVSSKAVSLSGGGGGVAVSKTGNNNRRTVAFLHRAYGCEPSSAFPEVSIKIEAAQSLRPFLVKLALLQPGQIVRVSDLLCEFSSFAIYPPSSAAVPTGEGHGGGSTFPGNGAASLPSFTLLRRSIGVLIFHGYLRQKPSPPPFFITDNSSKELNSPSL